MIAATHHPVHAEVIAALHSAQFELGFSPRAWEKITNFAILKKLGVYDVELMRFIQLMHSMFNMNNKRIGREMIANEESYNQILWEAYRSHKGHRSIECVANKVFTTDIARQEH